MSIQFIVEDVSPDAEVQINELQIVMMKPEA